MISVSLREFAATGNFGPIRLGMTRDEIRHLLGTPEMWGTEKRLESATIWRYGDIEFYFTHHELRMIFTDHDALADGGETCQIEPWVIRPGLLRDEFETMLNADENPFKVSVPAYDQRQRLVLTAANVQFCFVEERDPELAEEELGLFAWSQRIEL